MRPGLLQRVLRFGAHQIGVPYTWGGTTRAGGFDCSGLVWAAYTRAGYQGIGRTTYDQIKQGIAVGPNQLQPGDIVFPEPGHEGLYVGNGMILEAPHTGTRVQLIPLQRFGFWQARRLLRGGGGIIPPPRLGGVSPAGLPVPHPQVVAQQQAMAHYMAAQQQMFKQSQATMLQQLQTQAAQSRQQALASQQAQQLFQQHQAAAQAQSQLTGQPAAGLLTDPTQNLVEQQRQKVQDLRTQALQKVGLA